MYILRSSSLLRENKHFNDDDNPFVLDLQSKYFTVQRSLIAKYVETF